MGVVVVALDGSAAAEQALPSALQQLRERELVLVRVAEPYRGVPIPPQAYLTALDAARDTAQAYLEARVDELRAAGHPVRGVLREGLARQEILALAEEEGAELIFVSSHGRSGVTRWLLGSVAESLCRSAHCPVWVVRGRPHPNPRHLLVPLDTSPPAEAALQFLTHGLGVRGRLVRLLGVSGMQPACTQERQAEDWVLDSLRAYLEQQAGELRRAGAEVAFQVDTGLAAERIVHAAEAEGVELVVMATQGRTGLQRTLLGSVAERVLRHSPCPVVLVKREVGGQE